MTNQLKEFVYLNEVSINNHLSSMGRGVPEEIVQRSGEETETSGNAKVGIPSVGLGAGGQRSYLDSDNLETRITVTGPVKSYLDSSDWGLCDASEPTLLGL